MPATKKSTTSAAKATAKKATKQARSTTKKATSAAKRAGSAAAKATQPVKKAARRATSSPTAKRGSGRRNQQDALDLLKADHRKVEALFAKFEKTGDRAQKTREELVDQMIEALSMHAAIEEDVFYPAVRREVPETNDDILEALEEHHLVKTTLAELERTDRSNERFKAKVTVLIENVRHHVEEEEGELFPGVRKELGSERLRELGEQLAAAQKTAPTRPHPHAPDTPPASIVAQALSAPMDIAANVSKAAARGVRNIVG